jgi:isocitrate dehydrogenase (NAD+)
MKMVDGEFLKAVREVAAKYPSIEYKEMIVDNASMQMASNPWQFDVMVLPNLYGSILANIVTFLVGGPGITPGVNIGPDFALFEPGTRHLGHDIAGKELANPTSMILSSAMMLRHLNLPHFAERVQNGVFKTIKEGKVVTSDIGGNASTYEFTKEVIKNISSN